MVSSFLALGTGKDGTALRARESSPISSIFPRPLFKLKNCGYPFSVLNSALDISSPCSVCPELS